MTDAPSLLFVCNIMRAGGHSVTAVIMQILQYSLCFLLCSLAYKVRKQSDVFNESIGQFTFLHT